jgi:hypothetical protein
VINHEIIAAALRWHTARTRRLEISAEQRKYQQAQMQRTGFGGASCEIGTRLSAAKRIEQAALRALAKVCVKVKVEKQQVVDADVIDVDYVLPRLQCEQVLYPDDRADNE